ncbi:MAG: hypothetical protein AAGK66_03435 [Pseudomonadota bacterium]
MSFARISFAVGSVAFIIIGLLHTYVHCMHLSGAELFNRINAIGVTPIGRMDASVWGLFQGTSLLMGFFSLALGLTLMSYLNSIPKYEGPRIQICLIVIGLLIGIIAVGSVYLSVLQVYGGIFGIICFAIPITARLKFRPW